MAKMGCIKLTLMSSSVDLSENGYVSINDFIAQRKIVFDVSHLLVNIRMIMKGLANNCSIPNGKKKFLSLYHCPFMTLIERNVH